MTNHKPEEWRNVSGHPDYDVSSLGRIRSWKQKNSRALNTPRILQPHTHPLGYLRLTIDGAHVSVHQLVAAAWHGPCPDGREVDHINNIKADNRPENLQYLTRQENLLRRESPRLTHCKNGHAFAGDNLYIRPSNGRQECKQCASHRANNRPAHNRKCTAEGCIRIADCRLLTDQPLCEKHYQRDRAATRKRAKQLRALFNGAA